MADRFPEQAENDLTYLVDQKNGDRMIKQLLNAVIAKYRDLSVYRSSIICREIDLLAIYKSRYFAQPRPIIVIPSSEDTALANKRLNLDRQERR